MKKIIKLGIILAIYAAVSCLCLAVVNNFTSPVIKALEIQKENDGLKIVFENATNFIPLEKNAVDSAIASLNGDTKSVSVNKIFCATDSENNILGYVARLTGPTYESSSILLAIDTTSFVDGDLTLLKVNGVHILSTTDSPGYGQKAADPKFKTSSGKTFYGQFAGTKPLQSFESNKDYEAISGATISSNGFASMILVGTKVIASCANSAN